MEIVTGITIGSCILVLTVMLAVVRNFVKVKSEILEDRVHGVPETIVLSKRTLWQSIMVCLWRKEHYITIQKTRKVIGVFSPSAHKFIKLNSWEQFEKLVVLLRMAEAHDSGKAFGDLPLEEFRAMVDACLPSTPKKFWKKQ